MTVYGALSAGSKHAAGDGKLEVKVVSDVGSDATDTVEMSAPVQGDEAAWANCHVADSAPTVSDVDGTTVTVQNNAATSEDIIVFAIIE